MVAEVVEIVRTEHVECPVVVMVVESEVGWTEADGVISWPYVSSPEDGVGELRMVFRVVVDG